MANVALVAAPFAVLAAHILFPLSSPTAVAVSTVVWLSLAFAPFRFSVPSLGLLNKYRRALKAQNGEGSGEWLLAFSGASQLRAGYWMNVAATLLVAVVSYVAYIA